MTTLIATVSRNNYFCYSLIVTSPYTLTGGYREIG